jgi:hypothetical protein
MNLKIDSTVKFSGGLRKTQVQKENEIIFSIILPKMSLIAQPIE